MIGYRILHHIRPAYQHSRMFRQQQSSRHNHIVAPDKWSFHRIHWPYKSRTNCIAHFVSSQLAPFSKPLAKLATKSVRLYWDVCIQYVISGYNIQVRTNKSESSNKRRFPYWIRPPCQLPQSTHCHFVFIRVPSSSISFKDLVNPFKSPGLVS